MSSSWASLLQMVVSLLALLHNNPNAIPTATRDQIVSLSNQVIQMANQSPTISYSTSSPTTGTTGTSTGTPLVIENQDYMTNCLQGSSAQTGAGASLDLKILVKYPSKYVCKNVKTSGQLVMEGDYYSSPSFFLSDGTNKLSVSAWAPITISAPLPNPNATSSVSTTDLPKIMGDYVGKTVTVIGKLVRLQDKSYRFVVYSASLDSGKVCQPRPACLDATPACKMPEPVGGWCQSTKTCPVDDVSKNCPAYETYTDSNGCTRKICKLIEPKTCPLYPVPVCPLGSPYPYKDADGCERYACSTSEPTTTSTITISGDAKNGTVGVFYSASFSASISAGASHTQVDDSKGYYVKLIATGIPDGLRFMSPQESCSIQFGSGDPRCLLQMAYSPFIANLTLAGTPTKAGVFDLVLTASYGSLPTITKHISITINPGQVAMCDYATPPSGCSYVNGPDFNPATQCGKILSCPTSNNAVTITSSALNLPRGIFGGIDFSAATNGSANNNYKFYTVGNVPGMSFASPTCAPCDTGGSMRMCTSICFQSVISLSGTPTVSGSYPISITATDQNNNTATQRFTVVVADIASTRSCSLDSDCPSGQTCGVVCPSVGLGPCEKVCQVSQTCQPRPACLDATPACMMPEPAGGWCKSTDKACPLYPIQPCPFGSPYSYKDADGCERYACNSIIL